MAKPKRRLRSAAEIQQILDDLAASGLSRQKFATDRDIPLPTLHAWIARRRHAPDTARPELIPVGNWSAPNLPTPSIEIELPGGEILRLGPGFHVEDLRVVLAELRRC
jgi:hypothetical protein